MMRVVEVARRLNVSAKAVYALIAAGRLPACRVPVAGRRRLLPAGPRGDRGRVGQDLPGAIQVTITTDADPLT